MPRLNGRREPNLYDDHDDEREPELVLTPQILTPRRRWRDWQVQLAIGIAFTCSAAVLACLSISYAAHHGAAPTAPMPMPRYSPDILSLAAGIDAVRVGGCGTLSGMHGGQIVGRVIVLENSGECEVTLAGDDARAPKEDRFLLVAGGARAVIPPHMAVDLVYTGRGWMPMSLAPSLTSGTVNDWSR